MCKVKAHLTHILLLLCDDVIRVTYMDSRIYISLIIISILVSFSKYYLSLRHLVSQSLNLGPLSHHLGTPATYLVLSCISWNKCAKGMPHYKNSPT